MGIVRVNQLPEGSGSLTNDDIFLFMDDPASGGITKKISLSEIANAISSSGTTGSVQDIIAGTGISINSSSGIYTITSTGSGIKADEARALTTTVFNKTGSPIPKFRIVYIDGGQGDMPTITLAANTGELTSSKTYGITAEAISNMSTGKVIVDGVLVGVNTDQFNPTAPTGDVNGTILYLGSASGLPITSKPSAPNHLVAVGTIVRTHQNEGVVEVRIQNGFEIQELHNVAVSGVTDKQYLRYDNNTGLWVSTSSGDFSVLNVDNINIDSNTVSSTNTNGNITISPNGSGQIILGKQSSATDPQELSYANGKFSTDGDARFSSYILKNTTNSSGWNSLYLNYPTNSDSDITIDGATATFTIYISVRNSANDDSGGFIVSGCVKKSSSTVSLVGSPVIQSFVDSNFSTANVQILTSGSGLIIEVDQGTYAFGSTSYWVANVQMSRVNF